MKQCKETSQILSQLFLLQDKKYRDFVSKIVPTVSKDKIIGVRTPLLKKEAKVLCKAENEETTNVFIKSLPHDYFEENQLHAFIISEQKDFAKCIAMLEEFLPFADNWATTDQMLPKVFKTHHQELLPYIQKWISLSNPYTVRFAIGLLMQHFLDDDFKSEYLEKVAAVRSSQYYVNMMIAWYFATALSKQFKSAIFYIEAHRLPKWTHLKTIQKACESRLISSDVKDYLCTLKV